MHQYWGFGLHIESEIEFPELLPTQFSKADITIEIGKVPGELKGEDVVHKVQMSASPSEYLLDVNNVARYYACNGNTIIIEPYPSAETASIRLFMLSNAMAAILHQQNKIPLHASGIITDNGLVLFTGPSGIGKSTSVYGLMQKGYPLFSDDVCVLSYDTQLNKITAVPSYPMMKLWEDTLEKFPMLNNSKTYNVRPNLPKYGIFQHDKFTTEPLPVKSIYVLKTANTTDAPSCKILNKLEAFSALQQNTYRRQQIDIMQRSNLHFTIISKLSGQCHVFEIKRSHDHNDVSGFIDFIQDQLG